MEIDDGILARIYSFDLQFKGSKRTKFYRKLFGFKSRTKREDQKGREKVYERFYPGLLTPLPHLRLGKSVIAIPKKARYKLDDFFGDSKWDPIDLYSFDGILPPGDRMSAMREALNRIKITPKQTLDSSIEALLRLEYKDSLDEDDFQKIRKVIEKCERLMKNDWTDDMEFSESLRERISPLREKIE